MGVVDKNRVGIVGGSHGDFLGAHSIGQHPESFIQPPIHHPTHPYQQVIKMGVVDKNRVGIVGGSHGGFLGAHSIGQHPELFKVAALRNPVCNIASMTSSTDIPDWAWSESLGENSFDFTTFKAPTGR